MLCRRWAGLLVAMPRKLRRRRDPERSHGRRDKQWQQPLPQITTRTAHVHDTGGAGWQRTSVSSSQLVQLQQLHHDTVYQNPKEQWACHSSDQTDNSMQQLDVVPGQKQQKQRATRWREQAKTLLSSIEHTRCWKCHAFVAQHGIRTVDLNCIPVDASLWPHVDRQTAMVMIILVHAASAGGDMRVAKSPGVNGVTWRNDESVSMSPLAHRYRDTESVELKHAGDAVLLDGGKYVHEVTRVTRGHRDTVALGLKCVA